MAPLVDFEGLYRAHAPGVHRFVYFLSGDRALADDIVSETFVRLWDARRRVDLTSVRGYDEHFTDTRPGPERTAQSRDELRAVMAALQTLPDVDRAALLMRADENMPYTEIAAALGITVTSAKVKVHRARLALGRLAPAGVPHSQEDK
jgi:RNA polymerase sigma-70 factor (ECF subfamily)